MPQLEIPFRFIVVKEDIFTILDRPPLATAVGRVRPLQ